MVVCRQPATGLLKMVTVLVSSALIWGYGPLLTYLYVGLHYIKLKKLLSTTANNRRGKYDDIVDTAVAAGLVDTLKSDGPFTVFGSNR